MEQVKKKRKLKQVLKPVPIASAKPSGHLEIQNNLIPKTNESKQPLFANRVYSF